MKQHPETRTPGGNRANAEDTKENDAIVTQQAATCLDKVRHPLSAAFGDMPADEFAELVRDIRRNGQISDIVKAADGSILDGWHRYRACIEAGITPRIEPFSYIIEAAAEVAGRTMTEAEFVVAQNAHRRHLTAEQRRTVIAQLLKTAPEMSNRAIATAAKVDDKTVGAVRAKLEATAEIPHLIKTKGRDGKVRAVKTSKQQPMSRAAIEMGVRAAAAHEARQGKPAPAQMELTGLPPPPAPERAAVASRAPSAGPCGMPDEGGAAKAARVTIDGLKDKVRLLERDNKALRRKANARLVKLCAANKDEFLRNVAAILQVLEEQGTRNAATVSISTVAHAAAELRKAVARLAGQELPPPRPAA